MKPVFLSVLLATMSSLSIAQQAPCGILPGAIDEVKIDQQLKGASKSQATLVVPVVFHIVWNTTAQNIHDSMIFQQLAIMNNDFQRKNADTVNTPAAFQAASGGMDIVFCLAQRTPSGQATNGIVRVQTSNTSFASPTSYSVPDPVKRTSMNGSDSWDPSKYLNIWICNLTGSTAYSAPPGNFMPQDDGVVCHYNHTGKTYNYPYGLGRSIVHEIGHFFCLKHIWGDDNGACTGTDWINDTPNQANFSTNCPTFPKTDACTGTSPGVMFMNYMDYSEDGCRNMFSKGQVAYMNACINAFHTGFLTSNGCVPVGISERDAAGEVSIVTTKGMLKLSSAQKGISTIRLYNGLGQLLKAQQFNAERELEISVRDLPAGICIVEVTLEGSAVPSSRKKVIIPE